jgi:hypothetical protein
LNKNDDGDENEKNIDKKSKLNNSFYILQKSDGVIEVNRYKQIILKIIMKLQIQQFIV